MSQPKSTQTTCRVLANYQAAYPDPIIVRAGEDLVAGKEDPDYPGWIWCTDRNGKGGWVPDDFIERTVRRTTMRRIGLLCCFILCGSLTAHCVVVQEKSGGGTGDEISKLIGDWSGESVCTD